MTNIIGESYDPLEHIRTDAHRKQSKIAKFIIPSAVGANIAVSFLRGFEAGSMTSAGILTLGGLAIWGVAKNRDYKIEDLKLQACRIASGSIAHKEPIPTWVNNLLDLDNIPSRGPAVFLPDSSSVSIK